MGHTNEPAQRESESVPPGSNPTIVDRKRNKHLFSTFKIVAVFKKVCRTLGPQKTESRFAKRVTSTWRVVKKWFKETSLKFKSKRKKAHDSERVFLPFILTIEPSSIQRNDEIFREIAYRFRNIYVLRCQHRGQDADADGSNRGPLDKSSTYRSVYERNIRCAHINYPTAFVIP